MDAQKSPPLVEGGRGGSTGGAGNRRNATECDSGAGGDFQFSTDVEGDLGDVIVHEMADAVVGKAAEAGPFAQRAYGWLVIFGKDAASTEADDVGELRVEAGGGNGGWVHTLKAGCQRGGGACPIGKTDTCVRFAGGGAD